jgi:hypothetical protein
MPRTAKLLSFAAVRVCVLFGNRMPLQTVRLLRMLSVRALSSRSIGPIRSRILRSRPPSRKPAFGTPSSTTHEDSRCGTGVTGGGPVLWLSRRECVPRSRPVGYGGEYEAASPVSCPAVLCSITKPYIFNYLQSFSAVRYSPVPRACHRVSRYLRTGAVACKFSRIQPQFAV